MAPAHKIVRISVVEMYESCRRWTYYVVATTDEGFTKEVAGHRTGGIYNDFEGLSREQALDRALIDAETWGDFLGITPEPFKIDGTVASPSMAFKTYTTRRELDARRKQRTDR